MKKYWWILVWLMVMVVFGVITYGNVRIPEVWKSVSTGEMTLYCPNKPKGVKVVEEELPDRYKTVWVK